MKKTFKRFMAFVMAGVLLASPFGGTVANATAGDPVVSGDSPAEGKATASGDVEGYVDTDIFKVVLPTSVDSTTFDFIMDPQGLIVATEAVKHASADFASGDTVYFKNASGDYDYSDTSDYVEVINKGTVAVNVSVKASITGATGITMASADSFDSEDKTPGLYLALQQVSGDSVSNVTPITTEAAVLESQLAAVDKENYEFKVSGDEYVYDLKADVEDSIFPTYAFQLTGACNPNGDWSDVNDKNVKPVLDVVWSLTDAREPAGPSVSITPEGKITFTGLTADANVNGSAVYTSSNTKTTESALTKDVTWDTSSWNQTDGGTLSLQLGSTYMSHYAGQTVTVKAVLTNGKTITASVAFN